MSAVLDGLSGRDSWAIFGVPPQTLRGAGVVCLGAGEHAGRDHPPPHRVLPCFGAVYVLEGRGTFADGRGQPVMVEGPAVLWLYPGRPHSYTPDRHGWSEQWVLINGSAADLFVERRTDAQRPSVLIGSVDLSAEFDALRRGLSARTVDGALEASVAAQSALLALRRSMLMHTPADGLLSRFASLAHEQMSMSDRANSLGIEYRQMVRRVTEEAGVSPVKYLSALRVSAAQSLLASTDRSVTEIARTVGFDDLPYFSRLFSRQVGVSPARFRERQRRQQSNLARDNDALW